MSTLKVQTDIDNDPHNHTLRDMEAKLLRYCYEAEADEEKFLYQQEKIKWLSEGDKNSSYFHKVLKGVNNRSKPLKARIMKGLNEEEINAITNVLPFATKKLLVRDLYDARLNEDLKVNADVEDKIIWKDRNEKSMTFSVSMANTDMNTQNPMYHGGRGIADIKDNNLDLMNIIQALIDARNGNNIKSVTRRLVFAASVYSICQERNGRIFRDVKMSCDDVCIIIVDMVKNKLLGLTVKDSSVVRDIERKWAISCNKISSKKPYASMNDVLEKGPWMVKNKPLFVKKWSSKIGMEKVEHKKIPILVKIINVPLETSCVNGISALASSLRKPMLTDTMTANMCHKGIGNLGYARVLVEMDAAKELIHEIEIQYIDKSNNIKGNKKVQVVYDWKPPVCTHCKVFWHEIRKCMNGGVVTNGDEGIKNAKKVNENVEEYREDMIDYFKEKWEEDGLKERNVDNKANEMNDVLEINNGTTKVMRDNEINGIEGRVLNEDSYGIIVGWDVDETNVQVLHKTNQSVFSVISAAKYEFKMVQRQLIQESPVSEMSTSKVQIDIDKDPHNHTLRDVEAKLVIDFYEAKADEEKFFYQQANIKDLYDARLNGDLKVSDMVRNDQCRWPNEWREKFPMITNLVVLNVDVDVEDKII
uniref:Uncharacterized protein n=1 Tax=Tanacetum cinerariifolium TaxID=118510 RepID=A0A6L2M9I5_TANCI|nr:hypothetical protein [Tanacetum cinerariifolium]